MAQLLDDLKVLDLTRGMAGALATMMMADNGADVVKVEAPDGDPLRRLPAHHAWNRNKRSIVCDLKTNAGKARLFDLAAHADILIETYRPETAKRLGVDHASLKERFPHLVHVSLTGYGQTSSRANEPGYEPLLDAWLGLQEEQPGLRPGPHYNVFPIGTYGGAMLAVIGGLAAVHARRMSGKGQHVDTSLLDGALVLNTMSWQWSETDPPNDMSGVLVTKTDFFRRHMINAGMVPCGDGKYIQLHSGPPGKFKVAMEILGLTHGVQDLPPNKEKSVPPTPEEKAFLDREVPRVLLTQPRDYWIRKFEAADICALPVDPPGGVVEDGQVVHDRWIAEISDPVLGPIKVVGPTLHCPDAPPQIRRPAPALGQHDAEITPQAWTNGRHVKVAAAAAKHPMDGIRIVDFGNYFAGPYASRILSDLGAEAIKIEPPSGDALRPANGPFRTGQRGKRGLALDLKAPEGIAIARELIAKADVMTHNMRGGVAERLGLGFDEVVKLNPKIVYLHSTGFGASGPRSHQPAFAPLVSGMCGLAWQAAGADNPPTQSISNEDHHSGGLGATWLMMGLHYRNRTGKAVRLHTSLLGASLFITSELVMRPDNAPLFRFQLDHGQHGLNALCRLYKAADGYVCIVVVSDREWQALVKACGLAGLKRDDDAAIAAAVEAWMGKRGTAEALAALRAAGVPCEPSAPNRRISFFRDPSEEDMKLGRVLEYRHPVNGLVRESGRVIRFSDAETVFRRPAPQIGQHSREILGELGYDPAAIDALREKKVIAWPA
jgi:crotonobetainyl-CoA:carnitine CoA-transferase CaiB-like acyl-CoA transferase